jgi:hypothetical protein
MENEPTVVSSPVANAMNDYLRIGVETQGMPPADVAGQVLDAIRANRFWILTHPDFRHQPVDRMQRAADGENPVLTVM